MSSLRNGLIAAVVALAMPITDTRADEFPRFVGELSVEFQNDWTYDSDDPANELNDLFTTTEADLNFFVTKEFFINLHLTLEPVEDPDPGDDRFFEDHGLYVETFNASYETDEFYVFGGKFNPNFSLAFDAAPGIYGTDLAEDDIEISERIGFGGGIAFGDDGLVPLGSGNVGRHVLSASLYFADTSVFTGSILENRDKVEESDGGPSNTESLESFTVALDGEAIPALPGFRYQLAFARQEVERVLDDDGNPETDIDDEYRLSAAAEWAVEVNQQLTITPLVEFVRFWNAGGLGSEDRNYLTASALTEYGPWNLALSYTGRFIDNDAGSDFDDFQFQVSGGYTFENGLQTDVGWKIRDEANIESQTFGAFLTYVFEFDEGLGI